MESMGYTLMYFLRGSLPWQGLHKLSEKKRCKRILELKQAAIPDQLCQGYPSEFRDYFVHCSNLAFEDKPDYAYLKRIFRDLYKRCFEDDGIFDWDIIEEDQQVPPEVLSSAADSAADAAGAGAGDPAGNDTGANDASGRAARPSHHSDTGPSSREEKDEEEESESA